MLEEARGGLSIYIDVKHPEIVKLERLGISTLLYSMATEFCREYLGLALRAKSPKFFGSGALNIDEVMKRRAELWRIEVADIAVDARGQATTERSGRSAAHFGGYGVPQIVTSASITKLEVGGSGSASINAASPEPVGDEKILRIVDVSGALGIDGYYFRIMDAPARAFGNEIRTMKEVYVFWFGNRVTYVFSDGVNTAFHYELRLDRFIRVDGDAGGTMRLERPIQEFGAAMFVQIPEKLEPFVVPTSQSDVLVTVNYDWIDLNRGSAVLAEGELAAAPQ